MLFGLQNDLLYNEGIKERLFKDAMGICISKTPRKTLGVFFLEMLEGGYQPTLMHYNFLLNVESKAMGRSLKDKFV